MKGNTTASRTSKRKRLETLYYSISLNMYAGCIVGLKPSPSCSVLNYFQIKENISSVGHLKMTCRKLSQPMIRIQLSKFYISRAVMSISCYPHP